jgi:hypothetical protein
MGLSLNRFSSYRYKMTFSSSSQNYGFNFARCYEILARRSLILNLIELSSDLLPLPRHHILDRPINMDVIFGDISRLEGTSCLQIGLHSFKVVIRIFFSICAIQPGWLRELQKLWIRCDHFPISLMPAVTGFPTHALCQSCSFKTVLRTLASSGVKHDMKARHLPKFFVSSQCEGNICFPIDINQGTNCGSIFNSLSTTSS